MTNKSHPITTPAPVRGVSDKNALILISKFPPNTK